MKTDQFNLRVYGILIEGGKVLVTDEFRMDTFMTKFPGGGLHFGEGTIECLKREFHEELDAEITETAHYYTTDYFQPATLLPSNMQLISIYYLVKLKKPHRFITSQKKFDFPEKRDGAQCFRWLKICDLSEDEFTFPIDKLVVKRLKSDPLFLIPEKK